MIKLEPIGYVKNNRNEIEDDFWGDIESQIVLESNFGGESLQGIEDFSHLEIIFFFHKVKNKEVKTGASHPRGNVDWPRVGIFAQRKKKRPNRLGITIVKLLRREGNILYVKGLDAIDGTPVIDIKPLLKEFLPSEEEVKQPQWTVELMKNYFK